MTLRHLQIFQAVCRQNSITAAAEALNMAQPAVSVAIRELESFYGVRLFERMNRRIYLTEAGRTLLQYAQTVLSQFDESVQVLRDGSFSRSCSFGVNLTVGETQLPALTRRIQAAIPGIRLRILVENTSAIEARLARNEIDFGIVDDRTFSPAFAATALYEEPLCLVCSRTFPGSRSRRIEELADCPLLLREKGSGSRASVDAAFQRHGCAAVPILESASSECLLQMARAGLGIAAVPPSLAADGVKSGALSCITLLDDLFYRSFYLIRHRKKYETETMLQVIEIVLSTCRKN